MLRTRRADQWRPSSGQVEFLRDRNRRHIHMQARNGGGLLGNLDLKQTYALLQLGDFGGGYVGHISPRFVLELFE
jgi:hypothetical protein